jgi:hypothetical protein
METITIPTEIYFKAQNTLCCEITATKQGSSVTIIVQFNETEVNNLIIEDGVNPYWIVNSQVGSINFNKFLHIAYMIYYKVID